MPITAAPVGGAPPLPQVQHPVRPRRLGTSLARRALHTNKFFTTLFLGNGNGLIFSNPYVLRMGGSGTVSAPYSLDVSYSYWRRTIAPLEDGRAPFYTHHFQSDISFSTVEHLPSSVWQVDDIDDAGISANVSFGQHHDSLWWAPLVRGMPYVTAEFVNCTPSVRSAHDIVKLNGETPHIGYVEGSRLRLELSNGQFWLLYAVTGDDSMWHWDGARFTCSGARAIRAALEPEPQASDVLDRYVGAWAAGADLRFHDGGYAISWRHRGDHGVPILQCAQTHHLNSLRNVSELATDVVLHSTTKGPMTAVVGNEWILDVDLMDPGWLPDFPHDPALEGEIGAHLMQDILHDPTHDAHGPSNYFAGKALFRFAQQILVADALNLTTVRDNASRRLISALEIFAQGTSGNPLVYDETWHGIVARQGVYGDKMSDFGNSYYNDHHYHWGYFLGAAAIAHRWAPESPLVVNWIDNLIRDGANPDATDEFFPTWRTFDWYSGHSWSQGLFESGDGKDQESVSEEAMFHYGIMLWGRVRNDAALISRGQIMLSTAAKSAQTYFFIMPEGGIHPEAFALNRVTGIFFEHKVHYTTWFSPRPECIHGIQMIPVTPAINFLRRRDFVELEWKERLERVLPWIQDGWKSIMLADYARLDPSAAFVALRSSPLDDGFSRTWVLFWAASQQLEPTPVPPNPAPQPAPHPIPRPTPQPTPNPEPHPNTHPTHPPAPQPTPAPSLPFVCDATLVGVAGRSYLELRIKFDDSDGVSLVAVHYSVNGGLQWNVDVHHASSGGWWVHNGQHYAGSPKVSVGDRVTYWIYVLRRGRGEEFKGFSWIPTTLRDSDRISAPQFLPARVGFVEEEVPSELFLCGMSIAKNGNEGHLRISVRPTDPSGVSLVAVHFNVNGGSVWHADVRFPTPDGLWVFDGSQAPNSPKVVRGDNVEFWIYCIRRGLGEEVRGLSWRAA